VASASGKSAPEICEALIVAEKNLDILLRTMNPVVNDGEWVYCDGDVVGALATFRELEGTTSVVSREHADELGLSYTYVAAWITLSVYSDLEAIGFLAAVTTALAAEAISCNVVSALRHDHLFIPSDRRDDALRILSALQR
jgi:hypothetical protein